jgi:hypothetical protein
MTLDYTPDRISLHAQFLEPLGNRYDGASVDFHRPDRAVAIN